MYIAQPLNCSVITIVFFEDGTIQKPGQTSPVLYGKIWHSLTKVFFEREIINAFLFISRSLLIFTELHIYESLSSPRFAPIIILSQKKGLSLYSLFSFAPFSNSSIFCSNGLLYENI